MAEESTNTVNLDLNLGPVDNSTDDNLNFENWLNAPVHRVREVPRHRNHRWRLWRQLPIPPETQNLALELIAPQNGEGSVASDGKICENSTGFVEEEALGKKKDSGENNGDEGSFFDCNICLDLAKDPVVTCCGHLFCWPCLYRWLHHHSDAKECPVCKGEVTTKNVTPIYGRAENVELPDVDPALKIPIRPPAHRVESWRQAIQRNAFSIPMEEMIRRLGSSFDLNREFARNPNDNNALLNRILTSRGLRREGGPSDEVIDLTENRRFSSLLLRRPTSYRAAANLSVVDSYLQSNPAERNPDLPPPFDDRDSVSSIAAGIHSESQTLDNAVEIDSTVVLSTSSSRRRTDASRISDVDSGESRAPTRRRLN